MLIVHILTRLLRAGAEENTLEVARAQLEDGHRVVIVHGADCDPELRRTVSLQMEVVAVPTLVHPIAPFGDLRALVELCRTLRRLRPDVVHTHQSKAGVLGRLAARLVGSSTLIHGVHILPWVHIRHSKRITYLAAERLCAPLTDVFIDVSPAVRDECLARRIGRAARHRVAMSPMPVERFPGAPWPGDWRAIAGLDADAPPECKPPVILMLAAFEPRKRQGEFLAALAASACPARAVLVFAGAGPEMEAVRALAERLGWAGRTRFLGHRPDPERLVAMADVCALTSAREGLPRVVVQYAAGGRAMVVARLPGLEDVIRDDANALIAEGAEGVARAVARVLQDDPLRARLARAAAATDVSRWSPRATYPAVREAYQLARQVSAARR